MQCILSYVNASMKYLNKIYIYKECLININKSTLNWDSISDDGSELRCIIYMLIYWLFYIKFKLMRSWIFSQLFSVNYW